MHAQERQGAVARLMAGLTSVGPQVEEGLVCASDGHVAICCRPEMFPPADGAEHPPMGVHKCLFLCRTDEAAETIPWPQPRGKLIMCGRCKAKGKIIRTCANCGGDGQCACDKCEVVHDCGFCCGSGTATIRCPDCKRGYTSLPANEWIDGRFIHGRFVGILAELPGIVAVKEGLGEEHALKFRFEGGVGAVMPLRPGLALG